MRARKTPRLIPFDLVVAVARKPSTVYTPLVVVEAIPVCFSQWRGTRVSAITPYLATAAGLVARAAEAVVAGAVVGA